MEDKILNEKESLELISRMIINTKQNMEVGSGNIMLLWGYITVAISLIVFAGLYFTNSGMWNFMWYGIPIIGGPIMMLQTRKKVMHVKTYTDKMMDSIWMIIGLVMMVAMAFFCWNSFSIVLLPFSLIFVSLGAAITLLVIKEGYLSIVSLIGVLIGMLLLYEFLNNTHLVLFDILYFALGFVISLIIPGHYLNYKSKKNV